MTKSSRQSSHFNDFFGSRGGSRFTGSRFVFYQHPSMVRYLPVFTCTT